MHAEGGKGVSVQVQESLTAVAPWHTQEVGCAEIWGGVRGEQAELLTPGLVAGLYAKPSYGTRGGDIYFVSVCNFGVLTRIAIADVRGHGETVSAVSQWLYHALALRMQDADGSRVLTDLNALILSRAPDAMTTAAVVSFNHESRRLTYAIAGHPPPLVSTGVGTSWEALNLHSHRGANLPLGVLADVVYEEQVLPVQSGSQVLLYTDGVTECWSPDGTPFGHAGLLASLHGVRTRDPGPLTIGVVEALTSHAHSTPWEDDVTLIAMTIDA